MCSKFGQRLSRDLSQAEQEKYFEKIIIPILTYEKHVLITIKRKSTRIRNQYSKLCNQKYYGVYGLLDHTNSKSHTGVSNKTD